MVRRENARHWAIRATTAPCFGSHADLPRRLGSERVERRASVCIVDTVRRRGPEHSRYERRSLNTPVG